MGIGLLSRFGGLLLRARRGKSSRGRAEKGQGIVEFAMAFPLLLALMVGILEMGFAFNAYVTVVYAAREGARAGAVYLFQTDCPETLVVATGLTDYRLASNDLNRESGNPACGTAPNPSYYGDNIRASVSRALGPLDKPTATVQVTYSPNPPTFPNRYGDSLTVVVTYPYQFLTPVLSNASITLRGHASHRIEP